MSFYVGARAPERAEIIVTDPTFDFATVTDTDLEVLHPGGGDRAVWSWTLDASTPGQIKLTHLFAADGSDVPRPGIYTVTGFLVTAGDDRRITPAELGPFIYP